jgi:hypothetical protein
MAFSMVMIPAPTNVNTINETADELCKTPVTSVPERIDFNLTFVDLRMNVLKDRPAKFLMDSSIKNIPKRKIPNPARSFHMSSDSGINSMLTNRNDQQTDFQPMTTKKAPELPMLLFK